MASGDVNTSAQAVDLQLPPVSEPHSSTSGCEAEDFADLVAGNVAIVQRGNCAFVDKAINAEAAGAVGVVILNEGQEGQTEASGGTLGGPDVTIPVVGVAFAAVLETALQMAEPGLPGSPDEGGVRNRVRFAWWAAEEAGLLGSQYYVDSLREQNRRNIVANLNVDMVASLSLARFVYDGDGSDTKVTGPEGSAFIEWLYRDHFEERGLSSTHAEFSGRSDYAPFFDVGIPAGGPFTGAEGIKTEAQVFTVARQTWPITSATTSSAIPSRTATIWG